MKMIRIFTDRVSVADPCYVLARGPVLHREGGLVDQLAGALEEKQFIIVQKIV